MERGRDQRGREPVRDDRRGRSSVRDEEPDHRIEMFTGLLPAKDDIALALAMLASNPLREGTDLEHGHTVTFADSLWEHTEMRSFLLLRPIAEIAPTLRLDHGLHVEFLQAIPIFASELSFKNEHGAEALMQRWESRQVGFWDPNRGQDPA